MNVISYLRNPKQLFLSMGDRGYFWWMSDRVYLSIMYRILMGKKLRLDNPVTFNEKLQYLKIHGRNNEYTKMVDKYVVKQYVAKKIGRQYVVPTFQVWNSVEEIDLQQLPEKFVLKCTHDSGGVVVVKDKSNLNLEDTKKFLKKHLKRNFYFHAREWPYKNVKPRILAERFLGENVMEVKLFMFDGKMKYFMICGGEAHNAKSRTQDYFDSSFHHLNCTGTFPKSKKTVEIPFEMDQMIQLSEDLSSGIVHVRVDWYLIKHKIYFGELTFSNGSGFINYRPSYWDERFGKFLPIDKDTGRGINIK